jgi:uncharacterized protein (TIGR02598 family)
MKQNQEDSSKKVRAISTKTPGQNGFSLIEVVLAIGVAAFCLVVMLGLIPTGLNTNKDSSGETAAANIARNILSDLRSTPKTNTTTPVYQIAFPTTTTPLTNSPLYFDESGATNSARAIASKYRTTIVLTSNSPTISVWIGITWPAAASPSTAPGRYEVVTAIDRRCP